MIKYTNKYINLLSLFITIIIFLIINLTILNSNINKADYNVSFLYQNHNEPQNKKENENLENNKVENTISIQKSETNSGDWSLEIPAISLKATISEGTTKEVMDIYVGHFEESPKINGNICLAAHNRGYKNNYFANLKKLKQGDEIIYRYKNLEQRYLVEKHEIIKDTDWTNLENTEENMITLITCIENEPEFRRCIQAREKKG